MSEPSIVDLVECAKRELALRERVYPKWVESGRLDARKAATPDATSKSTPPLASLSAMLCCALVGLCSCVDRSEPESAPNVIRYEFEGHLYISTKSPHRSGMAHDPRCPCHFDDYIKRRQEELEAAKVAGDAIRIKEAEYLLKRAFDRAGIIYGHNTDFLTPCRQFLSVEPATFAR